MRPPSSPWLAAWDLIDREWQGFERLLLLVLVALLVTVCLLRFACSLAGVTMPGTGGDLPRAMFLWLVMLSASLSLAEPFESQAHERGGLATRIRSMLACLFAAVVCVLLTQAALRFIALDLQLGSAGPLGLPGWGLLLPVPLMLLVMALRLLRHSLRPTV